jgi:hypothetical protein
LNPLCSSSAGCPQTVQSVSETGQTSRPTVTSA